MLIVCCKSEAQGNCKLLQSGTNYWLVSLTQIVYSWLGQYGIKNYLEKEESWMGRQESANNYHEQGTSNSVSVPHKENEKVKVGDLYSSFLTLVSSSSLNHNYYSLKSNFFNNKDKTLQRIYKDDANQNCTDKQFFSAIVLNLKKKHK